MRHLLVPPGPQSRKNNAIPPKWFNSLDTSSRENYLIEGTIEANMYNISSILDYF